MSLGKHYTPLPYKLEDHFMERATELLKSDKMIRRLRTKKRMNRKE